MGSLNAELPRIHLLGTSMNSGAGSPRHRADVPSCANSFGLEKRLRTGEEANANTELPRMHNSGKLGE